MHVVFDVIGLRAQFSNVFVIITFRSFMVEIVTKRWIKQVLVMARELADLGLSKWHLTAVISYVTSVSTAVIEM